MAIGSGSLSAKAKNGWAWRFGNEKATFAEIEPQLIAELETQGIGHNIRRLEQNQERGDRLRLIIAKLKDATDDQIASVTAALV